jgi:hypothetical protein
MVIEHLNNKSIIINTYTLKQLINGQDYFYANLYYGLSINDNNNIYVKQDWDQYTNCLIKDDIILEIENTPVSMHMYFDKFNKYIYIDTWITCMYMEKENHELKFKIYLIATVKDEIKHEYICEVKKYCQDIFLIRRNIQIKYFIFLLKSTQNLFLGVIKFIFLLKNFW